jgi:hypothetical protein
MQPTQPDPQDEANTTYYQAVSIEEPQEHTVVDDGPAKLPDVEPVHWQASEYIQHTKSVLWYVEFVIIVLGLMATAIFLLSTWTFALLIPVMAGALMVYAHRPARTLSYVLSEKGLYIDDLLHPLESFKAFGIIQGSQVNSLVLVPTKRFRPGLTVYFPSEVGEEIVDLLGGYLPMEEMRQDAFDTIVHKLRM